MFILSIILGLLALIVLVVWRKARFEKRVPDPSGGYGATKVESTRPSNLFGAVGAAILALSLLFLFLSSFYTQSVGQAKVLINVGGSLAGQDTTSGIGFKKPWQSIANFDVFSQNLYYAGNSDHVPEYVKGDRDGQEVTASVHGGVTANMDVQISYKVNADNVEKIYRDYRTQDRFIQQMTPNILSELRKVPPAYDPIPFRGENKAEAEEKMRDRVQKLLAPYGIIVAQVTLQDVRYPGPVEDSIRNVQVAQQKQAESEALQRAAEVDARTAVIAAQGQADAAVASAQGQASANQLLTQSLTPEVLQQRYIDALKGGTVFVVPQGSSPLINVPTGK